MAGRGVEVVVAGGLLVVVGFGVGALGTVAGRVGDFDKAPAVEHKARPSAVGGEPPGPVDLTEEEGCHHPLLLVGVEAAVLGGELLCHRFGDEVDGVGRLTVGAYDQAISVVVNVRFRVSFQHIHTSATLDLDGYN